MRRCWSRPQKKVLSDEQLRHPGLSLRSLILRLTICPRVTLQGVWNLSSGRPSTGRRWKLLGISRGQRGFTVSRGRTGQGPGGQIHKPCVEHGDIRRAARDEPLTETMAPSPNNYYSLTKHMSEHVLGLDYVNTGIKAIVVRFPSIFGKNHLGGLVPFTRAIFAGDAVEIFSRGERLESGPRE